MEILNEFLTWQVLGSYAGAIAFTSIFVQFTKDLIDNLTHVPTKLYTYIISVVILLLSDIFTGDLTLSNAVLNLFNGFIVSVAANGSYDMLKSVK